MGDSGSWLSELDDDVITYRSLFGANLSEFASLGLTARRRHEVRTRVLFFCALTVLVLLLPSAVTTLAAVQLRVGPSSPLAIASYLLFTFAVLGALFAVLRSLAVCRAACGATSREALLRPDSVVSDESSSLLDPPAVAVRRPNVVNAPPPLSTTARPVLAQASRQAATVALPSGAAANE